MTPNSTRLHGPAMRGSRLSRGSRSGLWVAVTRAGLIRLLRCERADRTWLRPRPCGGEVQAEDGAAVVGEDLGVAAGLGGDELAEGERPARDREVLLGVGGDLDEDPVGRTALVVLPGRVQEARSPAEGDRPTGVVEEGARDLLEVGVLLAVEVGHDRDVAASSRRAARAARSTAPGTVCGVAEPVATEGADLDGAVDERRLLGGRAGLVEQAAGGLLGALDVGLVERVDAEQAAGDGGGVLPEEQLGAEGAGDRDERAAVAELLDRVGVGRAGLLRRDRVGVARRRVGEQLDGSSSSVATRRTTLASS